MHMHIQSCLFVRSFVHIKSSPSHNTQLPCISLPLNNPSNKPSPVVLNRPLQLHSTRPLTGYLRTGYCESPPATDAGNHSVAAELSDSFLDFSAARGNDLRAAGVTAGCRWCLCVARWKEAFDAAMRGEAGGVEGGVVPRVWLERTNVRALEGVRLEDLRRFAVDGDAVAGGEGGGGGGGKKGEGK
ncbi:hypothetical protein BU24DRAFT_158776 [Aaosphaeria arxii CBS 175.79]|uniref:Uncharacterized protein n=1 Tax=Aaosphaeria arxii CBS 175.79 TaxID=1450172 RepID=A0A6A5XWR3_9PLEO|nr:uncharacterized protein BU24DRAFT_158776 [Aaosphaeria arxii CBS 175.79]KAF2017778.1 hypothetical protein BU24DRAFT_158776 [Aaosphaeria arxii CBS 175.79]